MVLDQAVEERRALLKLVLPLLDAAEFDELPMHCGTKQVHVTRPNPAHPFVIAVKVVRN